MLRARSKHLSSGAAIVVCKKIFVLHPALCRPAGACFHYPTYFIISVTRETWAIDWTLF
jgi:hypothetical protein